MCWLSPCYSCVYPRIGVCPWCHGHGESCPQTEHLCLFLGLFFHFLLLRFSLCRINGHHIARRGGACRLHECMVMQTCRISSFRVPCIISISEYSGCWEMQVANMSCEFSGFWQAVLDPGNQLQPHVEVSYFFSFLFFPFLLVSFPQVVA